MRGNKNCVGKRNAAKPAELHRVTMSTSVTPETLAKVKEVAAAQGVSIGRALDAIVQAY